MTLQVPFEQDDPLAVALMLRQMPGIFREYSRRDPP
jgi:hypothetical protein